jgi:PAS domain S-box-containing protein
MIDSSLILKNFVQISPWKGISRIQSQLLDNGFVVAADQDGYWGILTPNDVLRSNHRLVADCLPTLPFTTPNDNIRRVLDLMNQSKTDYLPCCSKGKLIGVISRELITEFTLRCTEDLAEALDMIHLANKKLEESELRFRNVFEMVGEGIGLIDNRNKFVFANASAEKILDSESNGLIGISIDKFLEHNTIKSIEKYLKSQNSCGPLTFDVEAVSLKGESKTLTVTVTQSTDTNGISLGFYLVFRDITERMKADLAVKVSEHKFRTLFENNADGLIIANPQTKKFLSVNKKVCDMLGYSQEELLKLGVEDIHPSEELERVYNEFNDLLIKNKDIVYNLPFRKKDGTTFFADIKNTVVEIEGDELLIGMFRDITERKLIEDALRISEEQFRNAFESSSIGMAIISLGGYWIKVNSKLCEIVGYTSQELEKMSFETITHPDDLAEDIELGNKLINGEISSFQLEKRYIHKNGESIWVQLNISLVYDKKGSPLHFISQVQNINDRKKAELALHRSQRKIRAIIDNIPLAVFWKDINNKYLGCNKKFADYVGMTIDEVIGKTDNEMPWEKLKENYISDDLEVFQTKQAKLNYEERGLSKNGLPVWVRTSKVPLLDSNNEVLTVIGIFEDITEQKKTEEELKAYRYHLELLVKEKTYELNEAQRIANIGSWKLDAINSKLIWSDEVFRIFEKDPETFTPTSISFDQCVHPHDLPIISILFRESLLKKTSYSAEHRILTSAGKVKWVCERSENHFDLNGNHTYSIGTVQDITSRKTMELALQQKDKEFELFFENINQVVIIFDSCGNTVYINKEFERLFGISISDQCINPYAFTKVVHPNYIEKLHTFIFNNSFTSINTNDAIFNFKILKPSNEIRWLSAKKLMVKNPDENQNRLIVLISDITKEKLIQHEILNAIIKSEEKERMRFAQDLHDGIGPLLSTTKLYLQWLSPS